MDVQPTTSEQSDLDARQLLQADLDRARAERDSIDRAIAGDAERITGIRSALETMMTAVWRDVFAQQQRSKDRENLNAALKLGWFGGSQFIAIGALVAAMAAAIYAFQETGVLLGGAAYIVLATINYFGFRGHCVEQIKKARDSYLGDRGKDVRFVAFTHIEAGLHHPLIGFDGPRANGKLDDRSWKIPGVRDNEALKETFFEVIDERRATVLLTRFPDKKPTLVHADLENPFIRAFGVFFQRALEKQLPAVQSQGDEFRQVVLRMGEQRRLTQQVKRIENELQEFDGTHAIMSNAGVPVTVRNKLLRQVVAFRLGDAGANRGMMMFANDDAELKDVAQTIARAASAAFVPFSFSSMKIGYVGQGATQVARTFEGARRGRSMIYIEDADRLFSNVGSAGYESMRREVVQAFLKQWDELEDRSDVWIVAGARNRDAVDAAILPRFGSLVDLAPELRSEPTIIIEPASSSAEALEELVVLPDAVNERIRILAAMFAHVDTMERQGISVPRAVAVSGPSEGAKSAAIQSLVAQAGLPLLQAGIANLDEVVLQAYERERAILVVDVPNESEPGAIAHLCILIDQLTADGASIFVIATATNSAAMDLELRSRFGEVLEIPGLDGAVRRQKFLELIAGKPVDFSVDEELDRFESETAGMSEERLREYVEEAIGRAAIRAIELGQPERVRVQLNDFRAPTAT